MARTKVASEYALTAQYQSPSEERTLSHPMQSPARAGSSTTEKTAHLAELRASVTQLQDQVNAFLTQIMEKEKRDGQGEHVSNGTQSKAALRGGDDVLDGEDELEGDGEA
ncbi:MAG: low-affinity phosphate transporter [Watsoniomyces obsoletus]|nr:MAG: low-affinity phosphate transporter [Watsoniomyces obsoletus]